MTNKKFQSCIEACYACATECKRCAAACLDEEDVKMLTRCIRLDSDCATVCVLSAKMMAGNSEYAERMCGLCADICNACAAECEKHNHMEHCKKCAEVCRKCSHECLAMIEVPV